MKSYRNPLDGKRMVAVVLCGFMVCLCACQQTKYYPPKTDYTPEEVQQLFAEHQEAFDEVAQILLRNDEAYAHRDPEGVSRLFLLSSEKRYRRYFSEQDYAAIDDFFRVFRPYSLERGADYVVVTFYCTISRETKGVSVRYF